jgi:hypothetical protein
VASHGEHHHGSPAPDETLHLSGRASTLAVGLLVVGVLGILASFGASAATGGGVRRFYHAYLTNYAYFLSLPIGAMLFVLIQHLTRAGWSVSIRRIAESLAATLPVLGLLAAPLLVSVWSGRGDLYPWAQPKPDHAATSSAHRIEHMSGGPAPASGWVPGRTEPAPRPHADDHATPAAISQGAAADHAGAGAHATSAAGAKGVSDLTKGKLVWLNPGFFTARIVFYFAFFSGVGIYFWKRSRVQDQTGDHTITQRLAILSAPLLLLSFLIMSFAALDLVMSLDPDWYSTMFGVYYFAGCAGGVMATMIITCHILQRLGYLRHSVSREHYHDMGKLLFGMTFFWGYIAFSQYMLIWYANLPETTYWFGLRGATTNPNTLQVNYGWAVVTVMLLFGRLLIPFAGLLSRHVKRNRPSLLFWAVWILAFHWLDMFWLVMPEYAPTVTLGLPEVLAFFGVGGVAIGAFVWQLSASALRPVRDPRLPESLVFQNI